MSFTPEQQKLAAYLRRRNEPIQNPDSDTQKGMFLEFKVENLQRKKDRLFKAMMRSKGTPKEKETKSLFENANEAYSKAFTQADKHWKSLKQHKQAQSEKGNF